MSRETAAPTWMCLEVWLGPMEGLSLAVEAAVSRTIRIGRLPADRASGVVNDLVLSRGVGVSAVHAELRIEAGRLVLRDLGSTNGTFAMQQRVTSELALSPGEIFLVSFTPVRVAFTAEARVPPPLNRGEPSAGGEAALADILAAARQAAEVRKESYIDSRHLCEAVFKLKHPWVKDLFRDSGWSRSEALMELWSGAIFKRSIGWASEVLNRPLEIKGLSELLWAPKVISWLETARRRAETSGFPPEIAIRAELLELMLEDPEGAVGGWLAAHGLKVPSAEETGSGGPSLAVVPAAPGEPLSEEMRALLEFAARIEQIAGSAIAAPEDAPGFSRLLSAGCAPSPAALGDALARLERWVRAVSVAQGEAPRVWFQRLWQRIGPVAIEAQPHTPGWKLRGEAADWWDIYRRTAGGLGPDAVRDQVREVARELSREALGRGSGAAGATARRS